MRSFLFVSILFLAMVQVVQAQDSFCPVNPIESLVSNFEDLQMRGKGLEVLALFTEPLLSLSHCFFRLN